MYSKDKAIEALKEGKEVYFRYPSTTKFIKATRSLPCSSGIEYHIGSLELDLGIK